MHNFNRPLQQYTHFLYTNTSACVKVPYDTYVLWQLSSEVIASVRKIKKSGMK